MAGCADSEIRGKKFLAVPSEALVYTMKGDKKYFPGLRQNGNLMPNFIFVANIESSDPSQIIAGNEKVVRPRLADAEFFFKTDCKSVWKITAAPGHGSVPAATGYTA